MNQIQTMNNLITLRKLSICVMIVGGILLILCLVDPDEDLEWLLISNIMMWSGIIARWQIDKRIEQRLTR
jgi:hypothetical protein